MPKPLLFACFVVLFMLVPTVVVVLTARGLARIVGRRWPAGRQSPLAIVLLSLAPAAVGLAGVVAAYLRTSASRSGSVVPWAVIGAGLLWGGCVLFLLFLTSRVVVASEPSRLGVRAWLVACLIAAAWTVVVGFGLGVSQGIH